MLEKPDLPDLLIIQGVESFYGLDVHGLTFLPLGYDVNTAVYRLDCRAGTCFLKLRKGRFDPITVMVPKFLGELGLRTIIPPVESSTGYLFEIVEQYTIIVYPFISGKDGYQTRLTDSQWEELGRTFSAIHSAQVPPALASIVPHEAYDPQWRASVKLFLAQVIHKRFADQVSQSLSAFLKTKYDVIQHMVKRAEQLAEHLKENAGGLVLCHSDAHPGNYLVSDAGELYLVDWDNPIFALRERDLMCFGSGMSGSLPGGPEEELFYLGYGEVDIDFKALAYYRYERIIQDIAEFCKQIFLKQSGDEERRLSCEYLMSSFTDGHEVEVAFATDERIKNN